MASNRPNGRRARRGAARLATRTGGVARRDFLRRSGLLAGGLAALSLPGPRFSAARAAEPPVAEAERVRTVCTHCSLGCGIIAEVENGAWTGQEPDLDHPISLGGLCARGAGARYTALSRRRLKRPLKLRDGRWTAVSWEQAATEIADRLLELRRRFGPDAVYWLGSAHHGNEQAYLLRKLAAFWGTNNIDSEARLFHAAADVGLAKSWGYGASTNSLNDLHHARSLLVLGGSPAEDQPLSMLHILRARERNDAPLIVCGPRFSQTAALADEYVRYRPGTDVALVWGIVREIFANGWADRDFIRQRVGGVEAVRGEADKWTPEEVARVCDVPPDQLRRVARALGTNRPGAVLWCNPGTQGALAASNVRAFAALQLILGNVGVAGGGLHALRLHDNAQGASDMGVLCDSLPGYYGLTERAWRHWARVWDVDYDYLLEECFDGDGKLMQRPGIPGSRWFDGALAEGDALEQPGPVRAVVMWGHAAHLTSRLPDLVRAMERLDLVVNIAPFPSMTAIVGGRTADTYLLPSATQYETEGSVTNTHRATQWREQVVEPLFDARPDQEILLLLAERLGLAREMFKNIAVTDGRPLVEDVLREANRGLLQIGGSARSPERIKLHMRHGVDFDRRTLRAAGGPAGGDFYGLPWPCWGAPELRHPGTPALFDNSRPVPEGGLSFPAIFGLERDGKILWAEDSFPEASDIKDGYPEFTAALLKHLNWSQELTEEERAQIAAIEGDETDWRTDLSGALHRVALAHGCAPFGNGKARAFAWDLIDPVPVHREPLYAARQALIAADKKSGSARVYPGYPDRRVFRLPARFASLQQQNFSADYPLTLITGRLAEYDIDGEATRANAWLAELRRGLFVELSPADAADLGLRDGDAVWISGPSAGRIRAAAAITRRVGAGTVFLPVSFAGQWMGESLRGRYPEESDPYVLGHPAAALLGEGYDPVGGTPEIFCGVCRIEKA